MSVRSLVSIFVLCTGIGLAGCASTIGNVSSLEQATFRVGSTHKNEVANVLGFPSNRATDDLHEYWGYRQSPELTGLVYALPTSTTTVTTYTATKIPDGPAMMDSAAVIYTFDSNGTLIDVFENEQR